LIPLGLGAVAAGVESRVRIEAAAVYGKNSPSFGHLSLRGVVNLGNGLALGAALPLLFLPGEQEQLLDTGNIILEGHMRGSQASRTQSSWSGSARLILPAGTRDRVFLLVPGRDRSSGGLEAAAAFRRRFSSRSAAPSEQAPAGESPLGTFHPVFTLHAEVGAGLYVDSLTTLRFFSTFVGTLSLFGPLHLFAQVDPWVVWIPRPVSDPGSRAEGTPQLGGAAGLSLLFENTEITFAIQAITPHVRDAHFWVVFDRRLGEG